MKLAGLFGLWLCGRIAMCCTALLPAWSVALLDCAFAPALALWVSRAVLAARSRHNYGFVVLLATVCTGNVLMHAAVPGWLGQALFVGRSVGHQDLDRVTPCARTPGAC